MVEPCIPFCDSKTKGYCRANIKYTGVDVQI
jgi:hypothetical protein